MQHEVNRYKTFISSTWDHQELIKPLVHSGFFYTGKEDITKCGFCGIEIKNWTLDLTPDIIHKKMSKFCPLFLKDFSSYESRLETFNRWENDKVQKEKLAESGFLHLGYKDVTQCFDCKLKLESWDYNDDPDIVHKTLSSNCNFLQFVKNKKNPLEKYFCNICIENEKNTVFLPCAHVVCCLDCCININNKCPVCTMEIKQKIRIFI